MTEYRYSAERRERRRHSRSLRNVTMSGAPCSSSHDLFYPDARQTDLRPESLRTLANHRRRTPPQLCSDMYSRMQWRAFLRMDESSVTLNIPLRCRNVRTAFRRIPFFWQLYSLLR